MILIRFTKQLKIPRGCNLISLKEFAEKSDLFIIEDSCHGIGSFYGGKHTGCYSDVGIFSFSTPKIITTGQGGMLVTDNKELYEKFRMIKDFGRDVDKKHQMENAFDHVEMGYNFKFTEFLTSNSFITFLSKSFFIFLTSLKLSWFNFFFLFQNFKTSNCQN